MDKNNLPTYIDRYEIRGMLGEGAMGQVLLGFDPKLQREVAIKIISQAGKAVSKGLERFNREARAIATIRHPNIVEIYDYSGLDSQLVYLVMERLSGIDLFDLMDKMGVLPEPIVAAIGKEICGALSEAHRAGVIHRDLKPENVYIDHSGRVVLTDFGIAKAFEEDNCLEPDWSSKTEIVGTPGFMAPEQMTGQTLGPQTDLFALGAMLYNILTRQLPFDGKNPMALYNAIKSQRYIDPSKTQPLITRQMSDILRACLMMRPKDRPDSAEVLEQEFAKILALWGVTDLRSDLRFYMAEPARYEKEANARALTHELNSLKIALKDHDHTAADLCRARIELLDPNNLEEQNLTESGVYELDADGLPRPKKPKNQKNYKKTVLINRDKITKEHHFHWWIYPLALLAGILLTAIGLQIFSHHQKKRTIPQYYKQVSNQPLPTAQQADATPLPVETPALPAATSPANPATGQQVPSAEQVPARESKYENQVVHSKLIKLEIQTSRKGAVWLDGKLLGKQFWRQNVLLHNGTKHVVKAKLGKKKAISYSFTVPQTDDNGVLYINFKQGKAKLKWNKNPDK